MSVRTLLATLRRDENTLLEQRSAKSRQQPSPISSHTGLEHGRDLAKAYIALIKESDRREVAGAFAHRALLTLAATITPQGAPPNSLKSVYAPLDREGFRLADTLGQGAAAVPLLRGLHFVTSLYPLLMPEGERSALGAFYTPPALASRLVDQATQFGVDWSKACVLDPAAGGGAFLLQAVIRIRKALSTCPPGRVLREIATRVRGFELDPHAASLAQRSVDILVAHLSGARSEEVRSIVQVCNALEQIPSESFDFVVGNPPYGRVALSTEQRQRFARSLYGHANLYGVFTDIALRWTKPGGVIGYLTPSSFLGGQYFSALRGLLAQEAPPVAIDFVHARRGVFEDVLQETLLATYRKSRSRGRAQVHYLHVSRENEVEVTRNGTVRLPPNPTAPWLAPRYREHSALIRRIESMDTRFADWGYSVSTGPLVWNRFKSQLRHQGGGKGVFPLIWAESVTSDGRFVFRAQKKNHAPYFRLERGDDWLLVTDGCVLVQRTTAKEQARRLIAAELPVDFVRGHGGVVVENHLNMIRAASKPKVILPVVSALLNSRVADQIFRCMSGSVAVSAYELQALPLPRAEDTFELEQLVGAGSGRERLEAECARLFGVESA